MSRSYVRARVWLCDRRCGCINCPIAPQSGRRSLPCQRLLLCLPALSLCVRCVLPASTAARLDADSDTSASVRLLQPPAHPSTLNAACAVGLHRSLRLISCHASLSVRTVSVPRRLRAPRHSLLPGHYVLTGMHGLSLARCVAATSRTVPSASLALSLTESSVPASPGLLSPTRTLAARSLQVTAFGRQLPVRSQTSVAGVASFRWSHRYTRICLSTARARIVLTWYQLTQLPARCNSVLRRLHLHLRPHALPNARPTPLFPPHSVHHTRNRINQPQSWQRHKHSTSQSNDDQQTHPLSNVGQRTCNT